MEKLVRNIFGSARLGPALDVLAAWQRVAGPVVGAHIEPVRFAGGTLWVTADQAVWSHQLTFLRPDLLTRYEAEMGRRIVEDIRLTTYVPIRGASWSAPPKPPTFVQPPAGSLSPAEEATIAKDAAARIRNPELAERWAAIEMRIKANQAGRKKAGMRKCRACGMSHLGPAMLCAVCRTY